MAHLHLFRHVHANQKEQVGLLCIRAAPSDVKAISSIQLNGLTLQKGSCLNQKLECMVASASGAEIELHRCSTDHYQGARTRSKADQSNLLIPLAMIDRFQPAQSRAAYDAQIRTETTQFLREAEQLYKKLVPEAERAAEIQAYASSGGHLPQIELQDMTPLLASSACAAQINGVDVAFPRFQMDNTSISGDCHTGRLSKEAIQDTNRVLKGVHLYHRLQHYLCSHANASETDKTCFGKFCHKKIGTSKQLLVRAAAGPLFGQGKRSCVQLPSFSSTSRVHGAAPSNGIHTKLLSDRMSIHIPQHTVKVGHGKLGFNIQARIEEPHAAYHTPHPELCVAFSGAQCVAFSPKKEWCTDVQAGAASVLLTNPTVHRNDTPPELLRNRFSATSIKHSVPQYMSLSVANEAEGKPYLCGFDPEKGHLWLQRDQLLDGDMNKYNNQMHNFDASVYTQFDENGVKAQHSAADILLGPEFAPGRRGRCFKSGTQVLAVYPSAACVMVRHGPTGPRHTDDDVLIMHPHRFSLCDEALMQSLHSNGELHKHMSVREVLGRELDVDPDSIQLGTHPQSVRSVAAGRRQCVLTQPLNEHTIATWSAEPYMFQGKKLHNFAVDFQAPGYSKATAVLQVNTCPGDRENLTQSQIDFKKHSGMQLLALA